MQKFEQLGQLIDGLESLTHSMNLPLPAETHMKHLKEILPNQVKEFKAAFVQATGTNPWEGQP